MIFGKTKLELRVGIFVFAGIIILSIFVLSIGKFRTWASGYKVSFTFSFVNGVKIGAPVRFAGVDVGEVKAIKFYYLPDINKTQVNLECWVKTNVKIPQDSTVWINTLGLLGEKYVEVMPGEDYTQLVPVSGVIAGEDPLPMHELMQMASNIGDNLDQIILKIRNGEGTLGKFITDKAVYEDLEALADDLKNNPWKLLWRSEEKKSQ